jgi:hypothetical protein
MHGIDCGTFRSHNQHTSHQYSTDMFVGSSNVNYITQPMTGQLATRPGDPHSA